MIELSFILIAIGSWLVVVSLIIMMVVICKLCAQLTQLTNSCKKWVEIYFPPHINKNADSYQPSAVGQTKVTINRSWDEGEEPRD